MTLARVVVFALAAWLLWPAAMADSVDNTTIDFNAMANGSSDSFFVENAEAVVGGTLTSRLAMDAGFQLRGGLWRTQTDFEAGTLDNTTATGGTVILTAAGVDSDTLLYYQFDEAAGTSTADASSNALTGTLTAPAAFNTTGPFLGASSLDVTSDVGDQTDKVTSLAYSGAENNFTVEAWAYATSFSGNQMGIVSRYGNVANTADFILRLNGNNDFSCTRTHGADRTSIAGSFATLNTWAHFACSSEYFVHNDTLQIRNFIDGVLQGTNTFAAAGVAGGTGTRAITVGHDTDFVNARDWVGVVDEVRVSNVTRYTGSFTPPSGGFALTAPASGTWTSDTQDTGIEGTTYSQLRWNSTVVVGEQIFSARASDTTAALATESFTIITAYNNTSAACPCSSGLNLSGLSGRYFEVRANLTTTNASETNELDDVQLIPAGDDTGTFRLNSANLAFASALRNVAASAFAGGTNTVTVLDTNNLSTFNFTLDFNEGASIAIIPNLRTCYGWKNTTALATTPGVTLTFDKPATPQWGNHNVSAYLNGTLQTSNRTNATVFDYGVREDTTTVYANITTLANGSTWNVQTDFVCLNATAADEQNGSAISSFTVAEINVASGLSKSTTTGSLTYNGTELAAGGGVTDLRVSSATYEARDFTRNLPADGPNISFTLLQSTSGVFVTFVAVTGGGAPIAGVSVTGRVSVTNALVCSATTDGTGSARCFLDPSTTYVFTLARSGFETNIFTIQPTQTLFTVVMAAGAQTFNTTTPTLAVDFLPVADSLIAGRNNTIRLNVTSSACTLINSTLSSTHRGNTTTTSGTGACNATLSITWNLTDALVDERVTAGGLVHYTDLSGNASRWQVNRTFQLYTVNATNASAFLAIRGGSPGLRTILTPFGANFVALAFSFFMVLIAGIRAPLGHLGGGALYLALCSGFVIGGLLDTPVLAVAALSVLGVMLLRRAG